SGHMIEAVAVDSNLVNSIEPGNVRDAAIFARDYLGLKPAIGCSLERGQTYYPAPDYIDERVSTRYLRIEDRDHKPQELRFVSSDIEGFSSTGRLREVDAQTILNATAVGYIPNARLELQILTLAEYLGITLESWADCPLVLPEDEDGPEGAITDLKAIAAQMAEKDSRYRPSRGNAGQIRTVQSIFVDEGRIEGGLRGLKSRDMEFVIADEGTTNVAAVLPMNRHAISKEMMVGLIADFLPVPQRHKGNGMTVRAPSFALPREIKNMDEARAFIADKFKVKIDRVARLGESYFTHAGVTPQRVYPFAVAGMGTWGKTWTGGATIYAPIRRVRRLLWWDFDETVMYMMQRAMLTMGDDSEFSFDRNHRQDMKQMFMEGSGPKTLSMSDIGGLGGMTAYGTTTTSSGGGANTGGLKMTDALFAGLPGEAPVTDRAENENRAGPDDRKRKLNPK
ncbi:MAG: class I SAM-dependent methyltransferase, partial [Alphaproteobacteria bacterium]|nr:class I SAM-dependent methyltransferase [Alphaproteobacteria bacterium]